MSHDVAVINAQAMKEMSKMAKMNFAKKTAEDLLGKPQSSSSFLQLRTEGSDDKDTPPGADYLQKLIQQASDSLSQLQAETAVQATAIGVNPSTGDIVKKSDVLAGVVKDEGLRGSSLVAKSETSSQQPMALSLDLFTPSSESVSFLQQKNSRYSTLMSDPNYMADAALTRAEDALKNLQSQLSLPSLSNPGALADSRSSFRASLDATRFGVGLSHLPVADDQDLAPPPQSGNLASLMQGNDMFSLAELKKQQ
jgi:hypothetical protein